MLSVLSRALIVPVAVLGLAGCTSGTEPAAPGSASVTATVAADATESATPGESPLATATAGPGTGDLFVVGRVVTEDGPTADVEVRATIFPDAIAAELEEGKSFETPVVDSMVTGDDGSFALSVDPDTISSAFMAVDQDFLNFELQLSGTDFFALTNTTVWLVDGEVWRGSEQARVGDPVLGMTADIPRDRVVLRRRDGVSSPSGLFVQEVDPSTGEPVP